MTSLLDQVAVNSEITIESPYTEVAEGVRGPIRVFRNGVWTISAIFKVIKNNNLIEREVTVKSDTYEQAVDLIYEEWLTYGKPHVN